MLPPDNNRGRGGGRGGGRGRGRGRGGGGGRGGASGNRGSNQNLNARYGSNTSLNDLGVNQQNHGGQRRGGGNAYAGRGGGGGGGSNHPGDWICQQCGGNNFSRRTDCFKCHTPKAENAGGGNRGRGGRGGRGSGGGNRGGGSNHHRGGGQQGGSNWTCINCGEQGNYANRSQCFKCGANKDGTMSVNLMGGNNLGGNRGGGGGGIHQEVTIIKLLARANKNIAGVIEQSPAVYRRAFKVSKQLQIDQIETLITTMAKLRASFEFSEPPMALHCKEVVDAYVAHYAKTKADFDYAETSVSRIENVLHYVQRLLQIEWHEGHDEVKFQMKAILNKVFELFMMSESRHRELNSKVIEMMDNLEKDWTVKIKTTAREQKKDVNNKKKDKRTTASQISRWENATIDWLSNPKYFQANYLPKMKVPGDKISQGVYRSKTDYFDTICRLWIGLTFEDGNKALSPKCRDRAPGATKECGTVLWQVEPGSRGERCRNCKNNSVLFVCQNARHRGGLCERCCMGAKHKLMGPPGLMASTHIYDFNVRSVDFEGRIYLVDMNCRKPPSMQPIHWKSTSRLKVTSLVAVVKVQDREAQLKKSDRIVWAEVKLSGEPRDEFKKRERGQMVVSDLRDSKEDDDNELRAGDHVVVIDCMTFVPEHIPVLKALEDLQLSTLPFQDGALLNITVKGKTVPIDFDKEFQKLSATKQRRRIASYELDLSEDEFMESDHYDSDDEEAAENGLYKMPSIEKLIDFLVDKSKLEPLIQIRRNGTETHRLKQKLRVLVEQTTLDREQLKSFIESLVEPVHLTQGPPGTGKSYLGVVIVRALIMIREAWIETCKVPEMPILVLSYKNHAIDEFLVDLVKAEGHLSLLRIGGSSSNPNLDPYLEHKQRSYMQDTQKYKATLTSLYKHKTDYQSILGALSPLSEHHAFKDSVPTSKQEADKKKQVSYDAALYLYYIIARVQKIETFLETAEKALVVDSDTESEDSGYSDCDIANLWNDLFSGDKVLPNLETGRIERVENLKLHTDDIETLSERVAHYNAPIPEILYQWIIGTYPLPKCGISECFINVMKSGYLYCPNHMCRLVNEEGNYVCNNPRLPEPQLLCGQHCCQFNQEDCLAVRLDDPQIFCEDHVCFVCVRNTPDKVANVAEDEAPRNTCVDHPLCTAMVGQDCCVNEAVPKTAFCQEHAFPICKHVEGGKNCTDYVASRGEPFCEKHKPKPKPPPPPPKEYRNCQAISKKTKKPCRSKPLKGHGYCRDHLQKYGDIKDVGETETHSWDTTHHEEKTADPLSTSTDPGKPVADGVGKEEKMSVDNHTKNEVGTTAEAADGAGAAGGGFGQCMDNPDGENEVKEEDEEFYDAYNEKEPLPDEDLNRPDDDDDFYDDQYEHINDVMGIEAREDLGGGVDEDEEKEKENELKTSVEEEEIPEEEKVKLISVSKWSWELKTEDRLEQANLLEKKYKELLAMLNGKRNREIEVAREEYHKSKVRAKSRVYESKTVIGGTIVGCIGRLESIRKIKPFAILVEEASEVLEPLLFSCLGEDTAKFEMIGDHLQLKPQMMAKMAFENNNKINVSLFERLINAPPMYSIPSSCLSIQRRMRKNICDLTREFYDEIVEIEDHDQCQTKKIGDQYVSANYQRQRRFGRFATSSAKDPALSLLKTCVGQGREVPGVLPHIYFWTHGGKQTKATVGLSRINATESDMAVKLTQYLVKCGVPKQSIAILTPYKGQLMLMRKDMIGNGLLDKFNTEDSVRMSTVDRFQGDESDIVIISLVIDEKSRTGFVKLRNRLVVLLSRARLGMYILGNISYFESGKTDDSVAHWTETIRKLREPTAPDTDPGTVREDVEELNYYGPRLGDGLPICCPVHRGCEKSVQNAIDLQLGFCDVKCTVELDCSHPCNLPCHYPNMDSHNSRCVEKIKQPPCQLHNLNLTCTDVYNNLSPNTRRQTLLYRRTRPGLMGSAMKIDEALKHYRCPTQVDVQLPCQHEVQMTCADETDIADGKSKYPECQQMSFNNYVYNGCCHDLKVLCCVWYEYKQDPSKVPPCKQKVAYTPSCGHSVQIQCYLKQKYESQQQPFQCVQKIDVLLPRCGHEAKVSCDKAKQLEDWKGEKCAPGIVVEGQSYGPTDHICQQKVEFWRKCGHKTLKLNCYDAFEQSVFGGNCTENVTITNPECGHNATIPCSQKQQLESKGLLQPLLPITVVNEGGNQFGNSVLHTKCEQNVKLIRKCGHESTVKCCLSHDKHLQECKEWVTVQNKMCQHDVKLPCSLSALMASWEPWGREGHPPLLRDNVLHTPRTTGWCSPPDQIAKYIGKCKETIGVQRDTCEHGFDMVCSEVMKKFIDNTLMSEKCQENITNAHLLCGHTKDYKCFEYQEYLKDPTKTNCKEEVHLTCWNYKICSNVIESTCNKTGMQLSCKAKSTWVCHNKHSFEKVDLCAKGFPSHCPKCIVADMGAYATGLKTNNPGDIILPHHIPPELQRYDQKTICTGEMLQAFVTSQINALQALEKWIIKEPSWKRPLLNVQMVPCFRYGTNDLDTDFKSYFKGSSLNGVQLNEWTLNNIRKLISDMKGANHICVLFGIVFCCRVLVDPQDYPGKKSKPHKKNSWVHEHRNLGYSVLQHNRMNGWDHLVVWDPYPMVATHKVWLSISDLQSIVSVMQQQNPSPARASLRPTYLKFEIPEDATSVVTLMTFEDQLPENDIQGLNPEKYDEMNLGLGKIVKWDGVSLGRTNVFDEHAQKELMDKLQFCIIASGSKAASERPFDGINYINHLEKSNNKGKEIPDLWLLKALEQQTLEDFEESNTALDNYLKKVATNGLHPLHLIAMARQVLHQDKTSQEGKDLLMKFANLYPIDYIDAWMTDNEKQLLLSNSGNDEDGGDAADPQNPINKWETLKKEDNVECEQMDKLMELTGLRKVKKSAFDIFKSSMKFSRLSPEVQAANPKSLNFCFLGNAGSGKTTVARMLAGILKDSGARPSDTFIETSAQKLKDDGPEKFRELVDSAEGGVLFIDEAYDLDPKGDFKGKPIVSELLVIAENKRDKLSIILAGYEDDMNQKLFSFNEGIKSRFDMVYFEDFNEKELKTIWDGQLKGRKFRSDEKASLVVSKRLAKQAGRKGFGNARAVRKEVEKAIDIAMGREDFDENDLAIRIEDVMGESPLKNPKLKEVLAEIEEKIGWSAIKKSVYEMLDLCKKNYEKEMLGQKTLPIMLNRLFLGNPGTGKTTCAALYGRLLKELNILSVGDVVMASTSDLVGSVVGESQRKTNEILERARGKVLVIDEAYNLDDNMYGKQVLDTIVEKVQNTESDDIAVLLLGYEKQMREMLRNQNPGLARRFSSDYPFMFEDYEQHELLKILKLVCKKDNIILTTKVQQKVIEMLEKQKTQPNFGNAGAINNLIRAAIAKAASRPSRPDGKLQLEVTDIDTEDADGAEDENADPFAPLDKLYRMENIKEELIKIRNTFKVAKDEGAKDMPELGHFVFRGAPGTGKTTVARTMAKILFQLGLLPRNHVEETSGLDLTGEYSGQTKKKVQERLDAAKGGVLFIDEAYELGKGIYGEEALTTVLAAMTDPEYKLVIIIAGYPKDMEQMLARNVGLKSRFTRYFDFLDWTSEDCVKFFIKKAESGNFAIDEEAKTIVGKGTGELRSYPGWGNARDLIAMWKVILEQRASRVVDSPEKRKAITKEDCHKAVSKMLLERKPKVDPEEMKKNKKMEEARKFHDMMNQMTLEDTKKPMRTQTKQECKIEEIQAEEVAVAEEKMEKMELEEKPLEEEKDERDPGVPDEVWEELKKAKIQEEIEKQRLEKEIKTAKQ